MNRTERAIEAIDRLLTKDLGVDNLLLDTRLHLVRREEPGICVANYFRLRRQLSDWHAKDLKALRGALEHGIALEVIASNERMRRCLGLGDEHEFEDYCQETMKRTALEFHDAEQIKMSFCWS